MVILFHVIFKLRSYGKLRKNIFCLKGTVSDEIFVCDTFFIFFFHMGRKEKFRLGQKFYAIKLTGTRYRAN